MTSSRTSESNLSSRTSCLVPLSSRTSAASVGIYLLVLVAVSGAGTIGPDTRSLRSLLRDDIG
jgi:hypothetical protein